MFCTCKHVCVSSIWPRAGPSLKHPPCGDVWDVQSPLPCGQEWSVGQGGRGASPALGQSSVSVASLVPAVEWCVHGGKSWLTSVVLSCRFSGVRTDEAWPVFTLCVFPCLFLFPPHLHRTLPSNKTNFHLSDQREGWSFSLLIHLQYATSDGTFPVGRGEPSPKGEGAPQTGSFPGTATVCLVKSAYCLL